MQTLFGFQVWRIFPKGQEKLDKLSFKLPGFKKTQRIYPDVKICRVYPFFNVGLHLLNCCYDITEFFTPVKSLDRLFLKKCVIIKELRGKAGERNVCPPVAGCS